jgi:probable phosphoglycerate mutase
VQTAQGLFAREPVKVPAAVEQDFGQWEGKSRNLGVDAGWKGLDEAPPGGESIRQVQERMKTWLLEFYAAGKPGVLVTHKGVILAMVSLAMDWNMTGKKPFKIDSQKMQRLEVLPNGKLKILELNVEFSSK